MILLTGPFEVGQCIDVGNHAVGTVERISFHTTDVRLLHDGQMMRIPNSELAHSRIQNNDDVVCRRWDFTIHIDARLEHLTRLSEILKESITQAEDLLQQRGDIRGHVHSTSPRLVEMSRCTVGDITAYGQAEVTCVVMLHCSDMAVMHDTKHLVILALARQLQTLGIALGKHSFHPR